MLPDLSLELQDHLSHCLFDISKVVDNLCLRFNIIKNRSLDFIPYSEMTTVVLVVEAKNLADILSPSYFHGHK